MKEALIAITFNCNSRCQHCKIWQKKEAEELPIYFYKKLPKSLREINISGGEPFLRKDIVELIEIIKKRCKKSRIIISTNGLNPGLIKKRMQKILLIDKKIGVRVSIDGLKEKHNEIRGIKNAYVNALKSLEILKDLGIKDLGISFTLFKDNMDDLEQVFHFSKKIGIEFSFTMAHSSEIYYGKINQRLDLIKLKKNLLKIINYYLKSINPKNWFRAYFIYGLLDYKLKNKRKFNCMAGKHFFYLAPNGNVYLCNLLDIKLGNIKADDFRSIKKRGYEYYNKIAKQCNKCWTMCTTRPSLKKNKLKIIFWIFKNKWLKNDLSKI